MTAAPHSVRVVAALISHPRPPKRYLVQQRPLGVDRALLWEFPGGKVEPNESDHQALIRECREELGIELRVGQRIWGCQHHYHDLNVDLVLYQAQIAKGRPKPLRARQLVYLQPKEMRVLPFCEADLPLLEALEPN